MAENLLKKPVKGILKTSSSFENPEANKNNPVDIKWDEMNILQTLHPPDKDYGHMKIDEPKTPYSYYEESSGKELSEHNSDTLDANLLAEKINVVSDKNEKPAVLETPSDDENEEEVEETEEERAQRSAFEYKRKMHYNEFYAVKLARKLIDNDDDEEADEEN